MAVEIKVTCTGGVDCESVHGPSGARLRTTAPKDNGGDGSSFSPTDLIATGLASCLLTILALAGRKHGLDLSGATATVQKHMSTDLPRRIVRLPVTIDVPMIVDQDLREQLERAARLCPVHATLGDRVDAPVTFHWRG